jgi:hypothetical protein
MKMINQAFLKRSAVIGATALATVFLLNTAANAIPAVGRLRNFISTGATVPKIGGAK